MDYNVPLVVNSKSFDFAVEVYPILKWGTLNDKWLMWIKNDF